MSEEQEIVEIVHMPERVQLGTIEVAPDDVIMRATRIAGALKDVITKRNLFSVIGQKEYVRVEGWNTLGALLGVLPREREVKRIDDGFEAYVELIRANDAVVIGGASAICSFNERNWANRDDYAVRSMAITRATGKAFRLGFSWIMELAGYQATPFEEMPSPKAQKATQATTSEPFSPADANEQELFAYMRGLVKNEPFNIQATQFWQLAIPIGVERVAEALHINAGDSAEMRKLIMEWVNGEMRGRWADAVKWMLDEFAGGEDAEQ